MEASRVANLSFGGLLDYLRGSIHTLVDPRRPSNATRYSLFDLVMAAFSAFFMQSESFLEYQRQLNSRHGRDNAQSLFGLERIPSFEQIRLVLDGIPAHSLFPVFTSIFKALDAQGFLQQFKSFDQNLLVALDGTQYHRSSKISCPCCSTRTHKNGQITYFHQVLLPVLVFPEHRHVISLPPEFVTPQDGSEKQDCEVNAAKRWIEKHRSLFEGQSITLLGDDLYSHQPLCQHCLDHQYHFIFVCRPQSHQSLYEWLDFLEKNGAVYSYSQRRWNGREFETWYYRYAQGVPLREEQPALTVNWCEVKVWRESDQKQSYINSWITSHDLTPERLIQVVEAGRSRWKTENENYNVLKTRGYHLEHNFGHGQQHLGSLLLTLNVLAFLFHTVLGLVDERYQRVRQQRGTRRGFFGDLLSLTKYILFASWSELIEFMVDESAEGRRSRPSRPYKNTS